MKVWVYLIKKELVENVWTRSDVAFQLVTGAVSFKIREYKVSYRRQSIVIGINVDYPAIPEIDTQNSCINLCSFTKYDRILIIIQCV